jgi:predicted DCC family thiol-disulfide oxidoreductase YuxK
MTEDEAEEAVQRAKTALLTLKDARDDERRRFLVQLEDKYAARLKAAAKAIEATEALWRETRDLVIPDHAWEGRRVYRMVQLRFGIHAPWSRTEGIVETVRKDTKFPANLTAYRIPELGAVIVRLVRRDGGLGIRFFPFADSRNPWSAVDQETAP